MYLNSQSEEKTYRQVGDIDYDPNLDDSTFHVCYPDKIFQYFNNGSGPEYVNEKIFLDNYFITNYQTIELFEENGWIRIRFVVNCKGEADRYRLIQSDDNYQEKIFDQRITDQLLDLTKGIEEWPTKLFRDGEGDYYMYLIFKIKDGQLIEIMP